MHQDTAPVNISLGGASGALRCRPAMNLGLGLGISWASLHSGIATASVAHSRSAFLPGISRSLSAFRARRPPRVLLTGPDDPRSPTRRTTPRRRGSGPASRPKRQGSPTSPQWQHATDIHEGREPLPCAPSACTSSRWPSSERYIRCQGLGASKPRRPLRVGSAPPPRKGGGPRLGPNIRRSEVRPRAGAQGSDFDDDPLLLAWVSTRRPISQVPSRSAASARDL